jgi:hypothetical protein
VGEEATGEGKKVGSGECPGQVRHSGDCKQTSVPVCARIVLEEQRLQENSEGAITVMMSVQGRGSGLHVAWEMSVPEGILYYSTAYIDRQKVTA